VSTSGGNLVARYVIHTVPPSHHAGLGSDEEQLAKCYQRVLEVGQNLGICTLAFPVLSFGSQRLSAAREAAVAAGVILPSLRSQSAGIMCVRFVIENAETRKIYRQVFQEAISAAAAQDATGSEGEAKYDVFISYKSQDYKWARQVFDHLKSAGLEPFLSKVCLPKLGKADYRKAIDAAIENSTHMVVVTSSGRHARADWVEREWGAFEIEMLAGRKSGNLLTAVAPGCNASDLPLALRTKEVVDLTADGLERLVEFLADTEG
jgi:hypothetical protein